MEISYPMDLTFEVICENAFYDPYDLRMLIYLMIE